MYFRSVCSRYVLSCKGALFNGFCYNNSGRLSTALGLHSEATHKHEVELEKLENDHAGIAVIKLNRLHARNALGKTFVHQFVQHLESLKHDNTVHTVIIRSLDPKVFCAGADLKERAKMTNEEVTNFVIQLRSFTYTLYNLPMPTIAAIDGIAVGGGLEIALACDIRTASSTAKMGLIETTLAIIPGAGGTQNLSRVIGPALAKELIFTGRTLDGQEAEKIGLVNQAVAQNKDGNAAFKCALSLAEQIIRNGPVALRMAKFAINKGIEVDLSSGLSIEQACYAQVITTKDRLEGLNAFKEKRKPVYKGD